MPVSYNSKKLIPAPFVDINKEYTKTGNGESIGAKFGIVLHGKIVAHKGSPNSLGEFWSLSGYPDDEVLDGDEQLKAIERKQEAIRKLFAHEGLMLEITPWDGSEPIKCNPRILKIDFPNALWYQQCDYTVTMEADLLYGANFTTPDGEDSYDQYLEQASENWQLEIEESAENEISLHTFRLTHDVNAVGKRFYNDDDTLSKEAWEQAKEYVLSKAGFDLTRVASTGVLNLPGYLQGFNHVKSEKVNEQDGSYSLSESWIVASGTAVEDFKVDVQTSIESALTTVTIDGTITGLEIRDANYQLTQSKYVSASGKYESVKNLILSRAQAYSNLTLNVIPQSFVHGVNPMTGIISYSAQYNNRPSNLIPGAKTESITIVDGLGGDVFAVIPVIGRAAGPVLQDIGTTRETTRQLTIECIFAPTSLGTTFTALQAALNGNPRVAGDSSSVIQDIIDAANPSFNGYSQSFAADPQETWRPKEGIYSFNQTWVYQ